VLHLEPCRFDRAVQSRAVDVGSWTLREKYDLAGNAFASVCSIALLTAMVAAAPISHALVVKPLRGQDEPGEPGQDDSIEGEECGEEQGESETPVSQSDDVSVVSMM
jgi:hypothetical protein